MASPELRQFNKQVQAFSKTLDDVEYPRFVKAVSLQILRGVVLKTRVDTGRARGNWQLAIGTPPSGEVAADPTGSSAIARGSAALANYSRLRNVFIANNVPYISFLNNGNDKFAGDKMIERTLVEVGAIFP